MKQLDYRITPLTRIRPDKYVIYSGSLSHLSSFVTVYVQLTGIGFFGLHALHCSLSNARRDLAQFFSLPFLDSEVAVLKV